MILREISSFDVEVIEEPTRELLDINDLVTLEAENFELRNALNKRNQILHSKEEEMWQLNKTVRFLRGNIKYYLDEINRLDAFRASQDIKIPKHYQKGM